MKRKKKNVAIIIYSIVLLCISGINIRYNLILVPDNNSMIQRQIDFVTISTVFAGFSFTALGLLLGLSSEKLIELIKDTSIVVKKADKIIISIALFILSVIISLFFILGLNQTIIKNKSLLLIVDNSLYIVGIGYLIGGMAYFVYAVYELADLIKRVYYFNDQQVNRKIKNATNQMENIRKKMRQEEKKENSSC